MKNKQNKNNLLIIYGPNLNLISIKSLHNCNLNITLDKINTQIRKIAKTKNFLLKIIQTNEEGKAINFIQKNRKKIKGIIIYPGPWQYYAYGLQDLLNTLNIPFITIASGESIQLLRGIKNFSGTHIIEESIAAINIMVNK